MNIYTSSEEEEEDVNNSKQIERLNDKHRKIYRQAYRPAWESMKEFKDWLRSVPGNNNKAYCTLCQRQLHCHRLSLMKHKITLKHQSKELELKKKQIDNTYETVVYHLEDSRKIGELELSQDSTVSQTRSQLSNPESLDAKVQAVSTEMGDEAETESNQTSILSTHILDTTTGVPGANIHLVLYKLIDGKWNFIQEGVTETSGRFDFITEQVLTAGRYKLHYDIKEYFAELHKSTIFPFIEIVLDITDPREHYHIPLILNPYGYTTYKGS